jgi:5-methylcytosine-specific restriction enzyme subunit McrC
MENKIITLYEDRQVKLNLASQEMRDILSLKDLWGNQNIIVQADGNILLKKYVGFISKNKTKMQILPKIYSDSASLKDSEAEKAEAIALLFRLLQYSGFQGIKEVPDPQQISKYNFDLLEIFISIFIKNFIREFTRNVHRKYEMEEENTQFIKGKIMFPQTIIKNSYRKHLHYVEYDEFTENNLLNKIFKTIILRLLYTTTSSLNKKDLKLALVYLEDVDLMSLTPELFEMVKFNRLNEQYKPLFNLAKLFYYNAQPGSKDGDEYTFTMLIPLNKLFEYYIYKLLDKSCVIANKTFKVNYQKPQKYLAICDDKPDLKLEPDITIYSDKDIVMIIDAKYKNSENIVPNDIYQVLAYAARYSCEKLYLVYPVFINNKVEENKIYKISAFDRDVMLKVIHVDISNGDFKKVHDKLLEDIGD